MFEATRPDSKSVLAVKCWKASHYLFLPTLTDARFCLENLKKFSSNQKIQRKILKELWLWYVHFYKAFWHFGLKTIFLIRHKNCVFSKPPPFRRVNPLRTRDKLIKFNTEFVWSGVDLTNNAIQALRSDFCKGPFK